jgi:uncharacterized protein (TIGR02266 family)
MQTENNFYTGLSENLSEGGLFISMYQVLPVGASVDLTIALPGHAPIKASGTVRWVREHNQFTSDVAPGIGVQFTALRPDDQAFIEQFLRVRPPLFFET